MGTLANRVDQGKLFKDRRPWQVQIQRGAGGLDPPPGKSQVIWVSKANKSNWTPWKTLDPPPPPGKCWNPSGTLKNDSFL